ncbi:hypothetical protein HK103_006950 [Boothiomyces macroporosus]|uniref:SprT-like domain-containing protein n=1 Tax=Boothiomyces macroporosus TaxID=261099 RepID=A0AAD5UL63_9FUNG|nr:hypothetical protein HK103_006950 [Boothiomyces macroporosus]
MIGNPEEIEFISSKPISSSELKELQQQFIEFAEMEDEQLTEESSQPSVSEKPMREMVEEIYSDKADFDSEEDTPLRKRKMESPVNSVSIESVDEPKSPSKRQILDDDLMELPTNQGQSKESESKSINDKDSAIKALQQFSSQDIHEIESLDVSLLPDEDLLFDFDAKYKLYNRELFNNAIKGFEWSDGIISSNSANSNGVIKLSSRLCQYLSPRECINIMLHEMIHCYLAMAFGKPREHCEEFDQMMNLFNQDIHSNVTHDHSFPELPNPEYKWKCLGACSNLKPYMGHIGRKNNTRPGPNDKWFHKHSTECGGKIIPIKPAPRAAKLAGQKKIDSIDWSETDRRIVIAHKVIVSTCCGLHMLEQHLKPHQKKAITAGSDKISSNSTSLLQDGFADRNSGNTHSQSVSCLSVSDNFLVFGSEMTVSLFKVRPLKFVKTIAKTSGVVNCVVINDGGYIAVGSDEPQIYIYNAQIPDYKETLNHGNAVTSVDFHANKLISCGRDVKIWKKEHTTWKNIGNLDQGDIAKWNPSGEYFSVAKEKKVTVYNAKTFESVYSFDHQEILSALEYSPNGLYLACASANLLYIWHPQQSITDPVKKESNLAKISGITFHPSSNDLLFGDVEGNVGYWKEFLPSDLPHASKTPEKIPEDELFGVEDDIFNDVLIEHQAEEDEDMDEVDDFVVDDDGGGYAEEFRNERDVIRYQEREGKKALKELRREYNIQPANEQLSFPTHDIQEAFQPNSSPLKQNRQYLVFNDVGTVCAIESGTQFTMDVEFHDSSIRPFHFTDYNNYTLSSIGPSGVVFASQATAALTSLVYYRPFDNWANKSDWTFTLPKDESAQVVACTMSRVVVATNQQYIRVFSTSGIQVGIRSLSGPIVSMSGGNDLLFCVYHHAGVFHGNQSLAYFLLDMNTNQIVVQDMLPISPCSKLKWVGFSSLGYPCTFDSEGVLRGLFLNSGNMWTPLFDSKIFKKERVEEYWPVGVTESNFLCVVLKGNTHPNFPKPIINDLPLAIPLLEPENDTVKLEQQIIQSRLIFTETNNGEEAKIDKLTLQLLANACKNEQTQRALDLCDMLYLIESIDGAMKIAVFYQQPALGERMNHIKQKRLSEEKEEPEELYTRSSRFENTLVDDDFEPPVKHKKIRVEAPDYELFPQRDFDDHPSLSFPLDAPEPEPEIQKPYIPKSKPIPIPKAKHNDDILKPVSEEIKPKPLNPFGLDRAKKPMNPFGRPPAAEKVETEAKKRKQITLEGFVKKPSEAASKIRKVDRPESSEAAKNSTEMMEKFVQKVDDGPEMGEEREKTEELEKMLDEEKENEDSENIVAEKLAEMTSRPKGKGVAASNAGLAQFLYQK